MAKTTASLAACISSPPPVGGSKYIVTGSATAKNIRSTPMPAANNIEAHENVLNFGREWSGPSRMRPALEKATVSTKTTVMVAVRT